MNRSHSNLQDNKMKVQQHINSKVKQEKAVPLCEKQCAISPPTVPTKNEGNSTGIKIRVKLKAETQPNVTITDKSNSSKQLQVKQEATKSCSTTSTNTPSKKRTVREEDVLSLTKAVQRQRKENDALKARVIQMEDNAVRTEQLKCRLEELKERLAYAYVGTNESTSSASINTIGEEHGCMSPVSSFHTSASKVSLLGLSSCDSKLDDCCFTESSLLLYENSELQQWLQVHVQPNNTGAVL